MENYYGIGNYFGKLLWHMKLLWQLNPSRQVRGARRELRRVHQVCDEVHFEGHVVRQGQQLRHQCRSNHQQCHVNYREIRRATVWSYEFHRGIDGRVTLTGSPVPTKSYRSLRISKQFTSYCWWKEPLTSERGSFHLEVKVKFWLGSRAIDKILVQIVQM